ncbi:MAG: carbamoyltransferase HypF [Candidatus Zixiibacteriota bacterium]|nr:MAG: carbamoyltransferase HypF [candidate division Zixibacteria bacterium]
MWEHTSSGGKRTLQIKRRRFHVDGVVQGVGFRPFVFKLACQLGLSGFVNNDTTGVLVEVEGPPGDVESFTRRLTGEAPVLSRIVRVDTSDIDCLGEAGFSILQSRRHRRAATLIAPDVAVCEDCLDELFDPSDRRFRYPFINCTTCGPRYTIVESIPYDRSRTSMKIFPMCAACSEEYHNPQSRRFHAQPNACPVCGPELTLHNGVNKVASDDCVAEAARLLRGGSIVAIRGLGGFHLAVDARSGDAIEELRLRKGRARKPLAIMVPDLETARSFCDIDPDEEALLTHYTRPIVLLRRNGRCGLPDSIAPRNNYLGIMLPYTPLHHLLMRNSFDALIMTSGNYSEEPIAIDNEEAVERLGDIADYFLFHDRKILQRCDDSIAVKSAGTSQIIRRARGYVPRPVFITHETGRTILACGAELKNTVAISRGDQVFLSQHIGDLDNPAAFAFFENSLEHLSRILEIEPEVIAYDMHPEYLSTKWALNQDLPKAKVAVQHHHAHLASVMADNGVTEPTIGIILDGTGYGTDGTIWGGEVLIGDASRFERHAWLKPLPMPGAAAAIKEPWRMGFSYLYSVYGDDFVKLKLPLLERIDINQCSILAEMIKKDINCPLTSSCGRLFDAVSAILGIRQSINFEAQAAIELEMVAGYEYPNIGRHTVDSELAGALDTSHLIRAVVEGVIAGKSVADLAAQFHVMLAEMFITVALAAREKMGINRVALSGGVYQNRYFSGYLVRRMDAEGLEALTHQQVPTNDGGIALGQIVVADAQLRAGALKIEKGKKLRVSGDSRKSN